MKVKNITGIHKFFIINRVKLGVFFHYLICFTKKGLNFREFRLLIKRLLVYIKTLKDNKFYSQNGDIKLDLYVPFYPSKPFYKSCDKFRTFNKKLPCTIALVSMTKTCSFKCKHCYQRDDIGGDVALDVLLETVESLKNRGVSFFNIEGGDPFLRFARLKAVCKNIGFNGEIFINSTGDGITQERIRELQDVCNLRSIMFSMHSPEPEELNFFMGQEYAWNTMVHGINLCHSVGVVPSLNCCLMRDDFFNGKFQHIMERAKELKVSLIQIIHPKAAGAWIEGGFSGFSSEDISKIKIEVNRYNKIRKYRDYPVISAQIIEEDSDHYGCTAGGTDRVYINAKGDVQPCEFLNISFGNIKEESFDIIFNRMRSNFENPGQNWLCEKYHRDIHNLRQPGEGLPINWNKTRKLVENWDRGEATPMYKKIEQDLN